MSRSSKRPPMQIEPSAILRLYRRFSGYIKMYRGTLAIAVLCMIGAALAEIVRPWPLKIIFDAILIPQDNPGVITEALRGWFGSGDLLLAVSASTILLVAVIGGLLTFGQTYLLAMVGQKVVAAVRFDLYRHIQRLSHSFHDAASSGDLLARLTGDVRLLRDLLVTATIYFSARILVVIGTMVVMLLMDWRLTLVAMAVLPLLTFASFTFAAKIKGAARRQRRKESKVAHVLSENLSAIKVIQAHARESHENEKFQRQNASSAKAELRATKLEAHLDRVVQIILAAGTCAVVWYGVTRVRAGVLTPGDLLVFTAYLSGLYKPIRKLASLTGRLSKATACGERILAILELEPEIADRPNAVEAPRLAGNIAFDNVTFGYQSEHPVLNKANFTITAGEKIAFASPSGSGKTTIANLLLRFYDPQEGTVRIDGMDVRDMTLASLREQVAVLLQEATLFNASIRDNIAYGKLDASDEEIITAAKAANAHEFIGALPDGYETVVGERGATLSGGQRQRIAIARLMVRDAAILILDEPMTGLDAANEAAVRQALERLVADRTCLIIAHDQETVRLAERTMTIIDGTVTESSPGAAGPEQARDAARLQEAIDG